MLTPVDLSHAVNTGSVSVVKYAVSLSEIQLKFPNPSFDKNPTLLLGNTDPISVKYGNTLQCNIPLPTLILLFVES
jgi:hypothetical protein